jgi:hypothetical protein
VRPQARNDGFQRFSTSPRFIAHHRFLPNSHPQAASFVVEELLLLRIQLACHRRLSHRPSEALPESWDPRD